jgi:hypothetical protein
MNSISFEKEVYGIRWGKYINEELHILYEQNNMFDLLGLKRKVEMMIDNYLHFFVLKNYQINGTCYFDWVECEKEVILNL